MRISRFTDNSSFLLFNINDVTDNSGWWEIDVTLQLSSSNNPFGNNNDLLVSFVTNGSKGDKGERGITGFQDLQVSRVTLDFRDLLVEDFRDSQDIRELVV